MARSVSIPNSRRGKASTQHVSAFLFVRPLIVYQMADAVFPQRQWLSAAPYSPGASMGHQFLNFAGQP